MSKQNKKSTIVLRSTIYIKGKQHIIETRKEILYDVFDNMVVEKMFQRLNREVADACDEHNDYFPKYWAMEMGGKPCIFCKSFGDAIKDGCGEWCCVWKDWKERQTKVEKEMTKV